MSTQDPNVATDDGDDDDGDDVTTTAPTAAATSLLTVPTASASASVSIPGASVGTVGITVLPGGSTTTVTLATATGGAAVTRTVTGITAPTTTNGTTNGTSTDSGSGGGGGGLSQSAKIAIGVSVPLGILLLLLLTLGAYRMGSRGRHGGGGSVLGGLFGRRSRSGTAASGSPKALVPSANDDDDAEKAMLAEKNATQPRGPVELATGPDVPELPTAVNYQELAAGDPWEAKRALEAQQVGGYRGNAADDDDQTPRSREMLGGAGVLAGGGAARQVNYGVNMNRKPVAGAGGAPRREGSQASSSYGAAHSPVSPARTASQSHHSSSEPMSSISPMSSNSPMMPVELPGDTGMRRENG